MGLGRLVGSSSTSSGGMLPIVSGSPVSGIKILERTKQAGMVIIEAETKCPVIEGKVGLNNPA